jgi:ADP-ribose pyrophosphatase YjhB (NUDIX family)
MITAAGILFVSPEGKILLLKRSGDCDHAKEWCIPGGKLEDGENAEQAALREFGEECGQSYTGTLASIFNTQDVNVDYTTFIAHVEEFTPKLDHEHTAFMWRELDDMPNTLHPGVKALLASDAVKSELFGGEVKADSTRADASKVVTELDIAKQIRDGVLTSPQQYKNIAIFSLRITGTGIAHRAALDEYVERNPENYLTDEFLERCNGLPVLFAYRKDVKTDEETVNGHPEKNKLDSDSFANSVIGMIVLPYIKDNEVWGIAKIYDVEAAQIMSDLQLSTSPAVQFMPGTNKVQKLRDGSHLLIEGDPELLDHLAIVANGVWDKGGKPSGVLNDSNHAEMAETSRADSAEPQDSLVKENIMAEPIEAHDEQSATEKILALLTKISTDQEGIITRLEALEADEVKPETADTALMEPTPESKPAVPEEKPGIVADTEPSAEKLRMDSLEKEVSELKANAARQDNAEEKDKLMEAQGRADSVEQCYGDSAPRPLLGDTVIDYEKRMVMKHLARSPRWKNSNIKAINDDATFSVIRDEVYADAVTAAKTCIGMAEGTMREVIRDGVGGRKVHEWHGSPSVWTNEFKSAEMTGRIVPAQLH